MYNTNHQQDRGQQAPNVKPAPRGGHYILHIEDVITDTGKQGLAIYREPLGAHNPAPRIDALLKTVIASNTDAIGEVMTDVINRKQEGKQ